MRGCEAITINKSLPIVSLSTQANDKACFGVISDAEEERDGGRKDGTCFVTVSPNGVKGLCVSVFWGRCVGFLLSCFLLVDCAGVFRSFGRCFDMTHAAFCCCVFLCL